MTSHWMHDAVGYEVYVRSFCDTNGDGIGDLEGVRRHLDHFVDLGVDVVWLTPIYPSPDADHGYDVSDYTRVDERYGDVATLERLIADMHDRGLRLIMDIVPNHTSSQHPWFLDALQGHDAAHRDWYVWRDPGPDGGPPNNWIQHFGGPAWTLDERSGQYYMHLFLPEQPDLNWANAEVRSEFESTLARWFERGVDGFRIDVAHSLLEDPSFRDNPLIGSVPEPDDHPRDAFKQYEHLHDLDQDDAPALYRSWREIADRHGAGLVGEVYLTQADRWARYVDGKGLHSAFWFPTLHIGWDVERIRETLDAALSRAGERTSWPISSHDDPYAATRFGGGDRGRERALAYLTLTSCLPGSVFFQQGEELGLENAVLPSTSLSDPISTRNQGAEGRDGTRTPMTWEPGDGWGFTDGEPWLPFGINRRDEDTVAVQAKTPGSHLRRVRDLLHLRRELPRSGDARMLSAGVPAGAVAARVGRTTCVLNAGEADVTMDLPGRDAAVRFRSDVGLVEDTARVAGITVPPDVAVVLVDV